MPTNDEAAYAASKINLNIPLVSSEGVADVCQRELPVGSF
jgi:hypothetical protein